MTIFEDIKSNIEANGGKITDVQMYDSYAEIKYIDVNGSVVIKRYSISIDDTTGGDIWTEIL